MIKMPREYTLPPTERLDFLEKGKPKLREKVLRIWDNHELKTGKYRKYLDYFKNIKKQDFDYLGEFNLYFDKDKNYGIVHRLGIKEKFLDICGDESILFLHFYNILSKKGLEINNEKINEEYMKIKSVAVSFAMKEQEKYENVVSFILPFPKWMYDELDDLFNGEK